MEELKNIYTFKPEFTKEEIQDLIAWFETRKDRLPATLQINRSSHTENLPHTVKRMIGVITEKGPTPTFSGYIAHLFLIRERLKEAGME